MEPKGQDNPGPPAEGLWQAIVKTLLKVGARWEKFTRPQVDRRSGGGLSSFFKTHDPRETISIIWALGSIPTSLGVTSYIHPV